MRQGQCCNNFAITLVILFSLKTMDLQPQCGVTSLFSTRWYPLGIQLVSTYELPETPVGGGVFWGSQNSKCQVLDKLQFLGREGGRYSGVVKTDSDKSWPNFLGGGGVSWGEQGKLGFLNTNLSHWS